MHSVLIADDLKGLQFSWFALEQILSLERKAVCGQPLDAPTKNYGKPTKANQNATFLKCPPATSTTLQKASPVGFLKQTPLDSKETVITSTRSQRSSAARWAPPSVDKCIENWSSDARLVDQKDHTPPAAITHVTLKTLPKKQERPKRKTRSTLLKH